MLTWIMSRGINNLGTILPGSIGSSIRNRQGEEMGVLDEVTFHPIDRQPEYAILKSSDCFGRGIRVFAIPASTGFFEWSSSGTPVLKVDRDDLQFAEGIAAADCPALSLKNGQHIYELYGYPSDRLPFRRIAETKGQGPIHIQSFLLALLNHFNRLKSKLFSKYKYT